MPRHSLLHRWCLPAALFALATSPLLAQAPVANPPATAPKPDTAGEIAKLLAAYQTTVEGIATDREKWVSALETWYTTGLDKLLDDRKNAGDLDGVVAVKSERERLAAHAETTPDQVQAMFPAMRTLRGTFETNFNRVVGEVMKRSTAANQKYLADLETLQKQLTMKTLIDEAVQVKTERERFAAMLNAGSAPPAIVPPPAIPPAANPAPPSAPAPPPPAPTAGVLVSPDGQELIGAITPRHSESPVVVSGKERIATNEKFKPPVEITVVAKTDNTNLRLAYAADQIIFNWEMGRTQLRVDGGPASGKHKSGSGEIPKDTFVTIRWRVTPTKQMIYVNDRLRYRHDGDYSKIDKPVSVFTHGSTVTVQSIKVLQLPPGTE